MYSQIKPIAAGMLIASVYVQNPAFSQESNLIKPAEAKECQGIPNMYNPRDKLESEPKLRELFPKFDFEDFLGFDFGNGSSCASYSFLDRMFHFWLGIESDGVVTFDELERATRSHYEGASNMEEVIRRYKFYDFNRDCQISPKDDFNSDDHLDMLDFQYFGMPQGAHDCKEEALEDLTS